jgi:hypothetical protein
LNCGLATLSAGLSGGIECCGQRSPTSQLSTLKLAVHSLWLLLLRLLRRLRRRLWLRLGLLAMEVMTKALVVTVAMQASM